jgi:hypothetical protein
VFTEARQASQTARNIFILERRERFDDVRRRAAAQVFQKIALDSRTNLGAGASDWM